MNKLYTLTAILLLSANLFALGDVGVKPNPGGSSTRPRVRATATPKPGATSVPNATATPVVASATPTVAATSPGLQSVCQTIRPLTKNEIYKAPASNHIPDSDPRSSSTSFIVKAGSRTTSFDCIEGYDSKGNLIHKLGKYTPTGSRWASRHYGGHRCGTKETATAVAEKAIANTGMSMLYLKVTNSVCIEIPDPRLCYNSSSC